MPNSLTVALLRHGEPLRGPSDAICARSSASCATPATAPTARTGWACRCAATIASAARSWCRATTARALQRRGPRAAGLRRPAHPHRARPPPGARGARAPRRGAHPARCSRANRDLQAEIVERQRAERLQRALFRIAELSITSETPGALLRRGPRRRRRAAVRAQFLHRAAVRGRRRARVPVLDRRARRRPPGAQARHGPDRVRDRAPAAPLLADRDAHRRRSKRQGKVRSRGTLAHCWLGVPLFRDEAVVGVIAVQSYSPAISFTARDQELLTFVAHHIGIGLARKRAQDRLLPAHAELEQRVDVAHARTGRRQRRAAGADRRAPARRTAAHPPGAARRAHRPAQPQPAARPPGRGDRARAGADRRQRTVRGAVPRPGPLQAGQRQRRPCRRRRAADRSRTPHRRRACASRDMVARLGGDEFAILIERHRRPRCRRGPGRSACSPRWASRCWVAGRELFPSASIGIALWHPRYRSGDELLRDADAAMYRAKAARPRPLRGVRRGDARGGHAHPRPRSRPAPRDQQRRLRAVLPADRAPGRRRA